jgi:hypothetical protein
VVSLTQQSLLHVYALIVSFHLIIFCWRQEEAEPLFAKNPEIPA